MSEPLKVGDRVTWREPLTEDEGRQVFIVREVNAAKQAGRDFLPEQALIEYVCDMPIPPTTRVNTTDLKKVS